MSNSESFSKLGSPKEVFLSEQHHCADYLARHGFEVFPAIPRSKAPLTKDGFKSATSDLNKIREFYTHHPGANVAVKTGSLSNGIPFGTMDFDSIKALEYFESEIGKLPDTPIVLTARGCHVYFITSNPINSRIGLLPQTDWKGAGGYVLGVGSVHPTGIHYEWEYGHSIADIPIAKAPRWLEELLIQRQFKRQIEYNFKEIPSGVRNQSLASICGHLLRRNVDFDLVPIILNCLNKCIVNPPMDDTEIEKIINSIAGLELKRRNLRDE